MQADEQAHERASRAASAGEPPFPRLDALSVRIPLRSEEWTIWPVPAETWRDYVIGFPFELHPFAWDYVRVSSDGERVQLEPHYEESSFDCFWVDGRGHVTCHALGGLFPFTLGRQPELLEGLRTTLAALPPRVEPSDPGAAKTLGEIAAKLERIGGDLRRIPPDDLRREREEAWARARATARGRAAERFWKARARRSRGR